MPMWWILPARREPDARDEHSRFCRVAVQDNCLRRARQRPLELDVLGQLKNACVGALGINRTREPGGIEHSHENRTAHDSKLPNFAYHGSSPVNLEIVALFDHLVSASKHSRG